MKKRFNEKIAYKDIYGVQSKEIFEICNENSLEVENETAESVDEIDSVEILTNKDITLQNKIEVPGKRKLEEIPEEPVCPRKQPRREAKKKT